MDLKVFTMKIPLYESMSSLSPLFFQIFAILDICIKLGICICDFQRLNKSRSAICKSIPITPGLNDSFIRPLGSQHLLFFRVCSTFFISTMDHGGVFTSLAMFIILLAFSSFSIIKYFISGFAGLFRSLCKYFLTLICLTTFV